NQGRWISPDPAGLGAVNPTDPQTWNRYAYVANRPMNSVDPVGLDCITPNGMTLSVNDATDCDEQGGDWTEGPASATCVLDGVETSCGSVFNQIDNGNAAICPNNDCNGMRLGADGQFQQYVPGWNAGVMQDATNGDYFVLSGAGYWTNVNSSSPLPPQLYVRGGEDDHPGLRAFYNNPDCPHRGDTLTATRTTVGYIGWATLAVAPAALAIGEAGGAIAACNPGLNLNTAGQQWTVYCRGWSAGNLVSIGYDPRNGLHIGLLSDERGRSLI